MPTRKIIREILSQAFYAKIAVIATGVFALVNFWLITRTTTIPTFFRMAWAGDYFSSFTPETARLLGVIYVALYWLMTLAVVLLFGVAAALLVWLFKHSRGGKAREMKMGLGGTLAAMFAAGCPVCGTFLFSLIGVAGGIGIFPLKGLELKALSLGLMMGSVAFAGRRIAAYQTQGCASGVCGVTAHGHSDTVRRASGTPTLVAADMSFRRGLVWALTIIFAANQFLIGGLVPTASGAGGGGLRALLGIQGAVAKEIIAPKLNSDGRTTSLVKQPTITEIPAEPKGLDSVAAAQVVMFPTGTPFYAPSGVSFDDPVGAQESWGGLEDSLQLSGDLASRYQNIIDTFTCNYCCGGPTNVTTISRCGCRHAKAWRGMAKHLLLNYGDKYSDDEIKGEMYRWTGIWYPKGVIEDYLLATGRGDVAGHETHGGAGPDGRHGL